MKSAVLAMVALVGCARWTKADTALEAAFVVTQAIDYRQTSEAVVYSGEANPIIGSGGQNMSPAAYFLTTTLLHVFIAAALPRWWREGFQSAFVVEQTYRVYDNVDALESERKANCAARAGHSNSCF